jgi:hypothetical protein
MIELNTAQIEYLAASSWAEWRPLVLTAKDPGSATRSSVSLPRG